LREHVTHTGERRGAYKVLVGTARERDHFESLELNGGMIIKWVFKKLASGLDLIELVQNRDI
jgi:hypothetical protein